MNARTTPARPITPSDIDILLDHHLRDHLQRRQVEAIPQLRKVMTEATFAGLHKNARSLADLSTRLRHFQLRAALEAAGVHYPTVPFPKQKTASGVPQFTLDLPMKAAPSEFERRAKISLPAFVELCQSQSSNDYRPNKNLNPRVLAKLCRGYYHQAAVPQVVNEGVRVTLSQPWFCGGG